MIFHVLINGLDVCPKCVLSCDIVDNHFLGRLCVIFPGSHAVKSHDIQVVVRSHDESHVGSCDKFLGSCDRGNLSYDLSTTCTSHDLLACDPGKIQPCDPGKITHDLSRKWSSTMLHDKMCFGHMSNLLINMWKIMGMINKMHPLNNQ